MLCLCVPRFPSVLLQTVARAPGDPLFVLAAPASLLLLIRIGGEWPRALTLEMFSFRLLALEGK